jgi:ABC-type multidrug transport system fused ATPase/permease subunit
MNFQKKSFLKKLLYILSREQKRQLLFLAFLLLIGMLFEIASLGTFIPALSILVDSDFVNKYPRIIPLVKLLGNPNHNQLVLIGITFLLIIYILKSLFLVYLSWRQSKFVALLSSDLSKRLFVGYLSLPYTFHLQRNSAQLLRNIQTEVNIFMSVAQSTIFVTLEFSVMFGIALMLLLVEPIGALIISFFILIFALLFHRFTKNRLFNWGEARQFHDGQTNQYLIEGLNGVKELKVFGREDYFINKYNEHNKKKALIMEKQGTLQQIPRLYLELLGIISISGLIFLMISQGKQLNELLPTLGIFVVGAFRLIPSVNRVMISIQGLKSGEPVVNVLHDEFVLFNTESHVKGNDTISFNHSILFEKISFSYNNEMVTLSDISFKINKGDTIGLIGTSGSGKSTLVDILLGLLIPDAGKIKVDNVSISDFLVSWQTQIGYVPQIIYLIDDTLLKNIAFGIPESEIDMTAFEKALEAAQLTEFVSTLPNGYNTEVGERGVRLSGGQRQRIGIARALYHDPSILILDEATSSLDTITEEAVMESVNLLHGIKTLIIVAHRYSTLKFCDVIYKLEKGKIVSSGTFDKMINNHQNN